MKIAISLLLLLAVPALPAGSQEQPPAVQEILTNALERAEWMRMQNWASRFRFRVLSQSEKLNKEGEVEESQERLYETLPIEGVSYSRLLEKDGKALTYREIERERQREEEFRKKLREGKDPYGQNEDRVTFDENLINRYVIQSEGIEVIGERPAYVLSFRPRSDDLPVEKPIDRALNKSQGRLWIDTETHEILKLEFELLEKVGIWWGFVGSISTMRGELERAPVEGHDEAWLPKSFRVYMNGRVFFKSLHRNEHVRWSDFLPADEPAELAKPTELPESEETVTRVRRSRTVSGNLRRARGEPWLPPCCLRHGLVASYRPVRWSALV